MGLCGSSEDAGKEARHRRNVSAIEDEYVALIRVSQARNVKKKDILSQSDPYFTVHVGGKQVHRSVSLSDTKAPVWNASLRLPFSGNTRPDKITFKVWDLDIASGDDLIGEVTVAIDPKSWRAKERVDWRWLEIKDSKDRAAGELQVYVDARSNSDELRRMYAHYSYTHMLQLVVHDATGLEPEESLEAKADQIAQAYLRVHWGTKVFRTELRSCNAAKWNRRMNFWVDAKTQRDYQVKIEALEHDLLSDDDHIGTGFLAIRELFESEGKEVDVNVDLMTSRKSEDRDLRNVEAKAAGGRRRGRVRVTAKVVSKHEHEEKFFPELLARFDADEDGTLSRAEVDAVLAHLGVEISDNDFEQLWALANPDRDEHVKANEAVDFLRSLLFRNTDTASRVLAFLANPDGFSSQLMRGVVDASRDQKLGQLDVLDRQSGLVVKETIPAYVMVALKTLFDSRAGLAVAKTKRAQVVMRKLSIAQGRKYAAPESAQEIPQFIALHNLDIDEVARPVAEYKNFNEFFARKLKAGARPIASPEDASVVVSPADCRMMVFNDTFDALNLWIKGDKFTVEAVLGPELADTAEKLRGGALCIARLAPQDYHRWHMPVTAKLTRRVPIDGALYTVNPIAVNKNLNVFTQNKREVCVMETKEFGDVVMVCVGATMVGSINVTAKDGEIAAKGDEHGFFEFGGSTLLVFFPPNTVQFDADLVANSRKKLETLVKVGQQIATKV